MSVTPLQASPFKERCRACEAERFYQRQRDGFLSGSGIVGHPPFYIGPTESRPLVCPITPLLVHPHRHSNHCPTRITHLRIAHKNTPKKFFEKILKKGLQFIKSCAIITELSARQWYALLAQLDRASGYGPEGQGFESLRACQKPRNRKVSGFFCFSSISIEISLNVCYTIVSKCVSTEAKKRKSRK